MTRAHEQTLRTADQIEQEAAEWLVKVDGDGAPETSRALAAWLGANPRHRAAFLRISTAWRRADALRRLAVADETPDPDLLAPERPPMDESLTEPTGADSAWANARPPRAMQSGAGTSRRAFAYAIAATFGAALVGTIAFGYGFTKPDTYATTVGEFHRVTLADGSSISLNTSSRVRVSLTERQRRIELVEGEAQFDVANDAQRPFIVTAGETVVRALGTAFVVRMRGADSVDVLVSEGKVAIDNPSGPTLSAGQRALIRQRTTTIDSVDDMTRRLAWTEGMLIFGGETLSEAVGEFNRYNRRQLVISDPALAGYRIGGAFKATSPDRFATAVQKLFAIDARVQEGASGTEIRLSRATRDAGSDDK
jgi:transmembrane sensor